MSSITEGTGAASDASPLHLLDYRRRVSDMYRDARGGRDGAEERCRRFREGKDRLFRVHPASPLSPEMRSRFRGLDYYPFDPNGRLVAAVDTAVAPDLFEVPLRDDGLLRLRRVGRVEFEWAGATCALSLFQVLGYGGGLFLPFGDATAGHGTYGGGRYLLDTIKQADLGGGAGDLVLDFNFAYNPSCAYGPEWHCPLTPPENRLAAPVRAGERAFGPGLAVERS